MILPSKGPGIRSPERRLEVACYVAVHTLDIDCAKRRQAAESRRGGPQQTVETRRFAAGLTQVTLTTMSKNSVVPK